MSITLSQRLDARTAPCDWLRHTFPPAWTAGTLTQAGLRDCAAEYGCHACAFPAQEPGPAAAERTAKALWEALDGVERRQLN